MRVLGGALIKEAPGLPFGLVCIFAGAISAAISFLLASMYYVCAASLAAAAPRTAGQAGMCGHGHGHGLRTSGVRLELGGGWLKTRANACGARTAAGPVARPGRTR